MEKLPDRLLRSVPINKQTALVVSKGVRFEPIKKIVQRHWSSAPQCDEPPRRAPLVDVAGKKFGRFTVVKYFGSNEKRGALWLVKCACGDYETRTSKSINNPNNTGDRCEKCRAVLFLRQRQLRDGPSRLRIKEIREFD